MLSCLYGPARSACCYIFPEDIAIPLGRNCNHLELQRSFRIGAWLVHQRAKFDCRMMKKVVMLYTPPMTHHKKLLSELLSRLFLFQLIGYRIIVDYHTRNVLILKIERPSHQGLFRSASNYAFQKMHPSSSLKIPAALLIVRLTT